MFVYDHFCSLDLSISWEFQSLFAQCNSHCLDCVQFEKKIDNLQPSKQHKLRLGLSVETAERKRESLILSYSSNQKGIISMNIPATMTIIRLLVTNIHIANINQEPSLFSRELLMAALIHCFFTWKVKKNTHFLSQLGLSIWWKIIKVFNFQLTFCKFKKWFQRWNGNYWWKIYQKL